MFFVTLTLCAVALGVTLIAARGGKYGPPFAVQPAILLFSFVGGLPLLLLALLLSVLSVVSAASNVAYRTFAGWCVGLTIAALFLGLIPAAQTVSERIAQRDKYPFEDLRQRLTAHPTAMEAPQLEQATLSRLHAVEQQLDDDSWERIARARSIQRLHQDAVNQFVNAQGFGVSRMPIFSTPRSQPDPGPIEMPDPPYVPEAEVLIGTSELTLAAPSTQALLAMHQDGLADFVNQPGFGYQNSQGLVAGFESHRFRHMPTLSDVGQTQNHWLLVRLELVSLLEHAEPRVYESGHLPRMDAATGAATRSLDSFEAEALEKLRHGEDIVTRDAGERFTAVGSLRAAKQCLECHSAGRGELLGAFSYEFRPKRTRAETSGPEA